GARSSWSAVVHWSALWQQLAWVRKTVFAPRARRSAPLRAARRQGCSPRPYPASERWAASRTLAGSVQTRARDLSQSRRPAGNGAQLQAPAHPASARRGPVPLHQAPNALIDLHGGFPSEHLARTRDAGTLEAFVETARCAVDDWPADQLGDAIDRD